MSYTTNMSLLARVRAGDEISWSDFYRCYAPLIREVGTTCGVRGHDSDALVVLVMEEIFQKKILEKYDPDHVPVDVCFKYDPQKGRFRYFLRGVARNCARNLYRKYRSVSIDDEMHPMVADPVDEWESIWDREWERHILAQAMVELRNHVQTKTFVAFEMYAVKGDPVEKVAKFLECSVDSVYTAKSRCIRELKKIVRNLEEI